MARSKKHKPDEKVLQHFKSLVGQTFFDTGNTFEILDNEVIFSTSDGSYQILCRNIYEQRNGWWKDSDILEKFPMKSECPENIAKANQLIGKLDMLTQMFNDTYNEIASCKPILEDDSEIVEIVTERLRKGDLQGARQLLKVYSQK